MKKRLKRYFQNMMSKDLNFNHLIKKKKENTYRKINKKQLQKL